ncbi:hypothetical protein HDU86_003431 [Geranomyces michiganensis]|nr:hypothetical protein HDU86_003431 [Geranomyces michiganensis]
MHIVIIGAGPSGLVTAKTLLESNTNPYFHQESGPQPTPFSVTVLEQEHSLGGTFKYRTYENAELVSSKQLTAFSDLRFPREHSDHVPAPAYVKYLEEYAAKNDLVRHIRFGATVTAVDWGDAISDHGHRHVVEYLTADDGQMHVIHCDAIAFATGLHVKPNKVTIPGLDTVMAPTKRPEVIHSSEYRGRDQLAGRNVLILGCGETAMDIAYEARQVGKRVVISHRNGFLSFPKALSDFTVLGFRSSGPAIPLDTLISNLWENAFVHPLIRWSRFRWHFSDMFVKLTMKFLTGTASGCSQWVAPPKRVGRAWNFLNKSTRAMPYINRPYKTWYPWQYIARYLDDVPAGHEDLVIEVYPWIDKIDESGRVWFSKNGTRSSEFAQRAPAFRPDLIVCATGYTQESLFRNAGEDGVVRKSSLAALPELRVRDILASAREPTIAYIGLVRPNVGAIPPIAEMQAMWWCCALRGKLNDILHKNMPSSPATTNTGTQGDEEEDDNAHYKLLPTTSGRITYGVDHSAYVYQLAADIKAAPSLLQGDLLTQPRLLAAYCLCAAFTPLFRLVGPFAWDGAKDVVLGELWETVGRRGVLGNLFMTVLPMLVYGVVNIGVCVVELMFWVGVVVLDLLASKGFGSVGVAGVRRVFARGFYAR